MRAGGGPFDVASLEVDTSQSQLPPAQGFSICNNFFPPENFVNTSICWEAQLDVNIVYIENLNS